MVTVHGDGTVLDENRCGGWVGAIEPMHTRPSRWMNELRITVDVSLCTRERGLFS